MKERQRTKSKENEKKVSNKNWTEEENEIQKETRRDKLKKKNNKIILASHIDAIELLQVLIPT